jgi:hypothetical protein
MMPAALFSQNMPITDVKIERGRSVSFKDHEGWDIVVVPGYVTFTWISTSDSLDRPVLEFKSPDIDIGVFNDIATLTVTAAPSSFGRLAPG